MDWCHHEFDEEPTPRKLKRRNVSKRTTRWSPELANTIAIIIVESYLRYLVKETLAYSMQTPIHDIGHALTFLCKEGILSGPVQHPTEFNSSEVKKIMFFSSVRVGRNLVEWDGESWVQRVSYERADGRYFNPHTKPGYTNALPSKRELERIEKKFPRFKKSEWDGLAYKIERESESYRKTFAMRFPEVMPSKVCNRCGSPQPLGFREHDKKSCNDTIIQMIMTS